MIHFTGYKETVLNDNPFAFWTFDYDRCDSNGQPVENLNIKDEINNVHPAQVVNATDPHRGLSLGFPSLIPNQQGHGKCLAFCPDNYIGDTHNYAKSFLWIDHNEDFNFEGKNGFTLEFVYNKHNEYDFESRFVQMSIYPYIRPIFIKKDFIEIRFYCNDSQGQTQIQCKMPNGIFLSVITQQFDMIMHFAVTFEIQTVTTAQYKEISKLFLNGQIVAQNENVVFDFHATLSYPSPIYIGGTPDSPIDIGYYYRPDRHASTLLIDQIAMYAYPLKAIQIADHFKKMHEYEAMIHIMQPSNYWTCNNLSTELTHIKTHTNGKLDLITFGSDIEANILESSMILQKPFMTFKNGAGAFMPYGLNYLFEQTYQNTGFSLGGWYKLTTPVEFKDTILIDCLDVVYPFYGIKLVYRPYDKTLRLFNGGSPDAEFIEYPDFKLGRWYHFVITHDYNNLKLYINGELINTVKFNFVSATGTYKLLSHLYFGGVDGGNFSFTQWSCFKRPLQPQEAAILYSYNITHIVKGVTTVEDVPRALLLRFYDTTSGRLVNSVVSNPQTGEYTIHFPSDLPLYLIVTDENDKNAKSRIFPNIIPSEIPDYPINIQRAR